MIQYIGNDANGLSSLYISIIGFLTVAELGVGEAITFCMYKPIVEENQDKVAALYTLFKKVILSHWNDYIFGRIDCDVFSPQLAETILQLTLMCI